MNCIEKIKGLISNGEIKEASTNMLEDAINAVLGDPVSIGKIIIALAKSPFLFGNSYFGLKWRLF